MNSADRDTVSFSPCHIFDLDHTLVNVNTSLAYLNFLSRREILSKKALSLAWIGFFKFKYTKCNVKDIHEGIFTSLLKGVSLHLLEFCADEFIEETLWNSLYPPAFSAFRLQQHLGATVVLMSSSPAFIVERIAERLCVDHWEATEYSSDSNGSLQSVKRFLDGPSKSEQLYRFAGKKGFSLGECTTYSDSFHDLPFLLASGKAIAVNPDRRLRYLALQNKWEIL